MKINDFFNKRKVSPTCISKYLESTDAFLSYMKGEKFEVTPSIQLGLDLHEYILTPEYFAKKKERILTSPFGILANNVISYIRANQKTKATGTRQINKYINKDSSLYKGSLATSKTITLSFSSVLVIFSDVIPRSVLRANVPDLEKEFPLNEMCKELVKAFKFLMTDFSKIEQLKRLCFTDKKFKKFFKDRDEWDEYLVEFKYSFTHNELPSTCRFDIFAINYNKKKVKIVDLKTTSNPLSISSSIMKYNYDSSMLFYELAAKYYIAENLEIDINEVDFEIETVLFFCGTALDKKTVYYNPSEDDILSGTLKLNKFYKEVPQLVKEL